jgi:hypothetical protein
MCVNFAIVNGGLTFYGEGQDSTAPKGGPWPPVYVRWRANFEQVFFFEHVYGGYNLTKFPGVFMV